MVAAMPGSWKARLASLTLVALALRALWVALEPATSPQADETMWLIWGTEVLPSPEVAFPRRGSCASSSTRRPISTSWACRSR
jgi:hypothetical protein